MGLTQDFAAEIAPEDPGFARATPAVRRKYFEAAGLLILDELSKQLGKGIGRNGRRMRVRKQPVLRDGADGPVMEPHYSLSRVITLADYAATDRGVKLFWHAGTGHRSHRKARKKGARATPFGTILKYHADGEVPHAPVRDVRLSKARLANVRRRLAPTWARLAPKVTTRTKPRPKTEVIPKGVEVTTKLPKGLLKGPGLIDTRALRGGPPRGTTPVPPPKVPRAPKLVKVSVAAVKPPPPPPPPPPVVAPQPPPPSVGTVTRDEVLARLERLVAEVGASEASRPSVRNAAILELVRERQSATTTRGRFHGMTSEQEFHTMEFEGIRYHFPPLRGDVRAIDAIVPQLRALAVVPPPPPALAQFTRDVYVTTQRNGGDAHWEREYGRPGFVSAATAGGRDEDVVIFNGSPIGAGQLVHEMGHNLAAGMYGSTDPDPRGAYGRAVASGEPAVSDYATASLAEDFAEAVRVFVEDPASLRARQPLRYDVLVDLMREADERLRRTHD